MSWKLKEALELLASVEQALECNKPKWVLCSDRLPEEKQTLFVYTNFGDTYTCRLPVIIDKNERPESEHGTLERFTHWMPLPAAPTI